MHSLVNPRVVQYTPVRGSASRGWYIAIVTDGRTKLHVILIDGITKRLTVPKSEERFMTEVMYKGKPDRPVRVARLILRTQKAKYQTKAARKALKLLAKGEVA